MTSTHWWPIALSVHVGLLDPVCVVEEPERGHHDDKQDDHRHGRSQTTSSRVLWVVLDGVGFRFLL